MPDEMMFIVVNLCWDRLNSYNNYSWYLSNMDTFGAIQSVLISEVIFVHNLCLWDQRKCPDKRGVLIEMFPTVLDYPSNDYDLRVNEWNHDHQVVLYQSTSPEPY
jgi:hypothetical protein